MTEQEREIARVTTEANLELESLRARHHQEQRRLEELLQAVQPLLPLLSF